MDDELRALLRRRDESPGDVLVARKAALLASRTAPRELAAEAWQEVLRRSPRDTESEARLRELGCELLYRSTVLGVERFEHTVDRAVLARTPALPALFVSERAVTNEQFHRFLEETPRAAELGLVRIVADTPHVFEGGAWSLRGLGRDEPVRHATWRGAAAYAKWAHGRLLVAAEWERLLVLRAYGWDLTDEWVDDAQLDARGQTEHAVMSPTGTRWVRERARYEGPAFRLARDSWLRAV